MTVSPTMHSWAVVHCTKLFSHWKPCSHDLGLRSRGTIFSMPKTTAQGSRLISSYDFMRIKLD